MPHTVLRSTSVSLGEPLLADRFSGDGVDTGREGWSVAPGSRRVIATTARRSRSCMSYAGPSGPGHADWRQGCAPSERRSVSDRQSCPEPSGCPPAEATAREDMHECRTDDASASSACRGDGPAPTAGIDWASRSMRSPSSMTDGGPARAVQRRPHRAGAAPADRSAAPGGVIEVAIERPDGPVVDALLEAGSGGVRDRPEPAEEPARPVRVGRQQGRRGSTPTCWPTCCAPTGPRLRPLTRDSEPTITLRMTVRARQDLVARPGRDGQPAARPPADHPARGDRAVPRHRLARSRCGS